jgi:hypothetical protein
VNVRVKKQHRRIVEPPPIGGRTVRSVELWRLGEQASEMSAGLLFHHVIDANETQSCAGKYREPLLAARTALIWRVNHPSPPDDFRGESCEHHSLWNSRLNASLTNTWSY